MIVLIIVAIAMGIGVLLMFILGLIVNKSESPSYSQEEKVHPLLLNNEPIEQKISGRQQQQILTKRYAESDLLKQILNYICNGDYTLYTPREIIINHLNIRADTSGRIIEYDFVSNRVPAFEQLYFRYDNTTEEIVKPQLAMAEAINRLMGYAYKITDMAERTTKEHQYHDGESELWFYYRSNYVLMRLKPEKQF